MVLRQDKAAGVSLGATPVEIRPDGYRVYEGVARWGNVLAPYPDLDPPRVEFCPIDEVASPRALASAVGIPFTGGPRRMDWDGGVTLPGDHAADLLTPETAGDSTEGAVLAMWRDDTTSPPCVRVRAIAHTQALIRLIEGGAFELSLGYRCKEDRTPGFFNGQSYDLVQRGHEYNHLNVVERARSRTPDGRPARLDALTATTLSDGASSAVAIKATRAFIAALKPTAKPSYSLPADSTMRNKKKPPATITATTPANAAGESPRTDAAPEMSAEDAALLAQMSPEAQAALGVVAGDEVAEETQGADVPAEEVEAAEGEEAAVGLGAEESDAKPIAAVLATLAKIEERLAALEGKPAAPAPPAAKPTTTPAAASKDKPAMKTDSLLTDPNAIIAAAKEAAAKTFNDAASFVGVVRKDGHAANTTDEAAGVMLGVIKSHLPALVPMAEDCIKTGRTDSLTALYGQAETIRRDSLMTSQADALAEAFTAPANPGDGVIRAPAGMKSN